jgi:hypothetical protein
LLFIGANNLYQTVFQSIKVTSNPGIVFANGDSLSNRNAGKLTTGSMFYAAGFRPDTNNIPSHTWYVSDSLKFSYYYRTSSTIQAAINAIDSGTIYIGPGVYNEKVTLKSKVTLKGAGTDRTIITRTDDTCVVFINRATNISISDLTVRNAYSSNITATRNSIKVMKCYVDTLTVPTIIFTNLVVDAKDANNCYGVYLDSACAQIVNCRISVGNDLCSNIRLANGAQAYIYDNVLQCKATNPDAGILTSDDIRGRAYFGKNVIMARFAVFNAGTAGFVIRAFHNISDIDFGSVNNGPAVLLVNSSNDYNSNFYIP